MALVGSLSASAQTVTLTVYNDLDIQRQELIEVSVDSIRARLGIAADQPIVVRNAYGQQVASQVTYDGQLLVDAAVKPCASTTFTVAPGIPEQQKSWVDGRLYRIRKDDIGWENDRMAYRIYGPALQKSGERSFGIDVWTKNSRELTMAQRYYRDMEGNITGYANSTDGRKDFDINLHTSFHLDQGDGQDAYGVGPSLGCGAPALMDQGQLVLPYCYEKYRIWDNGPLRFTVELTFGETKVGQDERVVEHRIISLDKGSNYNRCEVWYDGLSKPRDMASGVVIHTADPTPVELGKNYLIYADPTDHPDENSFQVYVGCVYPQGADMRQLPLASPEKGIDGHLVGVKKNLKSGEHYTYYFGAAASTYDVRSMNEWRIRTQEFLKQRERPLVVVMAQK